MKREFVLKYSREKVAQVVKEIEERIEKKRHTLPYLYDTTVLETIISNDLIEIESTDENSFTEEDRKSILNVLRKSTTLPKIHSKSYREYIHDMLYLFMHSAFQSGDINYSIYHSSMDKEDSIFRNSGLPPDAKYTIETDCARNSRDLSVFLKHISNRADKHAHKKAYKAFLKRIDDSGYIHNKHPKGDLFSLHELYKKIHAEEAAMIDHGMQMIFEKGEALAEVLTWSRARENEPTSATTHTEKISPFELKLARSLIAHRKEIAEEIEVYLAGTSLAKILARTEGSFFFKKSDILKRADRKKSDLIKIYKKRKDTALENYKRANEKLRCAQNEMDEAEKQGEIENTVYDRYYLHFHRFHIASANLKEAKDHLLLIEKSTETHSTYKLLEKTQKEYIRKIVEQDYLVSREPQLLTPTALSITMAILFTLSVIIMDIAGYKKGVSFALL